MFDLFINSKFIDAKAYFPKIRQHQEYRSKEINIGDPQFPEDIV